MASADEIRQVRLAKLETLRAQGIDPYPATSARTHDVGTAIDRFDALAAGGEEVVLAGRALAIRGQGALAFVDLDDGTGKIQAFLRKDAAPAYEGRADLDGFALFGEAADQGDFLEFRGKLALSKRGEKTIFVSAWRILSKSLRAIPDAWYGLKDPDETLRRRYLDILLNPEVRTMVERRSRFWNAARRFLLDRGFVEVETPVLESATGGAEAEPFETFHKALDLPVYLRISAGELWQKRLLVAGLPRVFEIGRIFRNEGMSHEHLQDYTQLEFYQAYADYREGLDEVRELYLTLAEEAFGTTKFSLNGHDVDLASPWKEIDFRAAVRERHGVDVLDSSEEELKGALDRAGVAVDEAFSRERAADQLWKVCRREIGGPAVLIGVPVLMEPLAKRRADDPRLVERFQVILGGSEVGKGFSELNDPVDQRERFERQQAMRDAGDAEAQMGDWEYVEAMEHGMPPAFGFGVSERLFAFLAGRSVREAQIFPLMRPRGDAPSEA